MVFNQISQQTAGCNV